MEIHAHKGTNGFYLKSYSENIIGLVNIYFQEI
jgi:hypothetical protein